MTTPILVRADLNRLMSVVKRIIERIHVEKTPEPQSVNSTKNYRNNYMTHASVTVNCNLIKLQYLL